jgi:Zn-dependent protease with chaperone function
VIFAGLLELSVIAALGFAAATALACTGLEPLLRPWLRRLAPAPRARMLLGWIAAPAAAGVALTALAIAPSLLSAAGLLADHCAEPGHTHAHLCVVHPPPWSGHELPWLLLGIAMVAGLGTLVTAARAIADGIRIERSLRAASEDGRGLPARIVSSDVPLSVTAGLRRPRVFVSSGLLRRLPAPLLDAVVAHERAHVARHDTLYSLLAATLGRLHLPWTRHRLLAELALASEEACDDCAAGAVGSRVLVARAIVAVERLLARGSPATASAFTGGNVTVRVERLLRDENDELTGPPGTVRVALAAAALGLALTPVHHLTETLLHVVLGA